MSVFAQVHAGVEALREPGGWQMIDSVLLKNQADRCCLCTGYSDVWLMHGDQPSLSLIHI